MSYLIIAVGVGLIIFFFILRATSVLDTADGTIIVIIISFLMELTVIIMLFVLFVRDIKDEQYDNLKIIGEVILTFNLDWKLFKNEKSGW